MKRETIASGAAKQIAKLIAERDEAREAARKLLRGIFAGTGAAVSVGKHDVITEHPWLTDELIDRGI